MPVSELVDYIRTQTQEGSTAEDLRAMLMEAGWQELDIDNALHDVAAGLNPTTPGASIHEDLAQVRGMVAHLATRVKGIEATLATYTTPSLPVQAQLPSGFIGADHELTAATGHSTFWKVSSLIIAVGIAVFFGLYVTDLVNRNALAPQDQLIIAAAVGALLIVLAIIVMRRGRAWTASLITAGAMTLWATDTLVSWWVYHYIEWTVALGLGVLFVVIALVMGRWIQRLKR